LARGCNSVESVVWNALRKAVEVRPMRVARALKMLVAMVALAIGTLSLLFSAGTLFGPLVYSKDFGQEYLLARAIRDGVDPYLPVRELAERYAAPIGFMDKTHPTPHPPSLGILLLPLSVLPYPSAAVVWFVFELACLWVAVALLAQAVGVHVQARAVPLAALVLLAWPALLLDVNLGQLTTPMLALLAAAQLALLRSRSVLGGTLLGVSLLVKPIAWPWLIVLGAYGNWRAAGSAIAVSVVGFVTSGTVIGFDRLLHYVFVVLPDLSSSMATERTNISMWVIAPRALGTPQSMLAALLPAIAVLVVGIWIVRRRPPLLAGLAVATALSVVLSPIAWQFYTVIAALPMAYALSLIAQRGFRALDVVAILVVAVLLGVSYHQWIAISDLTGSQLVLLGPTLGVLLLALVVGRLSTDRASSLA